MYYCTIKQTNNDTFKNIFSNLRKHSNIIFLLYLLQYLYKSLKQTKTKIMDYLNRTTRKTMTDQVDESTRFDFSSSIFDMKQGLSAAGYSLEEIKLFIQGQLNEIL